MKRTERNKQAYEEDRKLEEQRYYNERDQRREQQLEYENERSRRSKKWLVAVIVILVAIVAICLTFFSSINITPRQTILNQRRMSNKQTIKNPMHQTIINNKHKAVISILKSIMPKKK